MLNYKRKKVSGIKKTATKRAKRKPTERAVLKSIKHAVSVQKVTYVWCKWKPIKNSFYIRNILN